MAEQIGSKPFKTSPNMFIIPSDPPSANAIKGVPKAGHKIGVIPQQPNGTKHDAPQQQPANIKGHIPEEHTPKGHIARGQTPREHKPKGHKPKGQIAKGRIAKGQQPRHGIRHINGEHKVKTVNPPLIPSKGIEQGIKHKHKGLKQSQSIQISGGHMHSQQEPIK